MLGRTTPAAASIDADNYRISGQDLAAQELLSTLINELAASDKDLVLVLDDYHVISNPAIHEPMSFLLDHLPSCLYLVIASHADPPLPRARLRARAELVELRSADLRFKADEPRTSTR